MIFTFKMISRLYLFITKFCNQCLAAALNILLFPLQLAIVKIESRSADGCRPLKSNEEVLNFHRKPVIWSNLVIPIAPRCSPRFFGDHFEHFSVNGYDFDNKSNAESRPEVFVCHDLAGNYRDDRFINGSLKWDDYRFYHWSGIDYFCYFSHEYVTIPTLPWINAAHRNGVKVLGTIIVESVSGRKILEDILKSENYMKSIADALVLIAKYCKFEGWLLNVECELAANKIQYLRDFVEYLTLKTHAYVPHGKIIWYDSIINTGQLIWQNELNNKNKLFFDVCDGILINYTWNEKNLEHTANIVNNKADMKKVFVGIDVFGRGQIAKFQSNVTLAKIRKFNFSVGIFAPGWTFEATREYGVNIFTPTGNEICNTHFIERNDRFWSMLWKYFYTYGPIELPFYTSFCLGSGKQRFRDGIMSSMQSWFNLSKQMWQPSVPIDSMQRYFEDSFNGGSCVKILNKNKQTRLFVSEFSCDEDIIFCYAFKRDDKTENLELLLNVVDSNGNQCQIVCGETLRDISIGAKYCVPLANTNLHKVLKFLSEKQEKTLPSFSPINGWEIRYYYLNFQKSISARIVDIGLLATSISGQEHLNETLLGAINMHTGMNDIQELENIAQISSWDFIA